MLAVLEIAASIPPLDNVRHVDIMEVDLIFLKARLIQITNTAWILKKRLLKGKISTQS
jgi:hypothetical protein